MKEFLIRMGFGLVGFIAKILWDSIRGYPLISLSSNKSWHRDRGNFLDLYVKNHSNKRIKPYTAYLYQYPMHDDGVANFIASPGWSIIERDEDSGIDKIEISLDTEYLYFTIDCIKAMTKPILTLRYSYNKFNSNHVSQAKVLFESESLGIALKQAILEPSSKNASNIKLSTWQVQKNRFLWFFRRCKLRRKADRLHRAYEIWIGRKNSRKLKEYIKNKKS